MEHKSNQGSFTESLSAFFKHSKHGAIITSQALEIVYANEVFYNETGLQLEPGTTQHLESILGEGQAKIINELNECLAKRSAVDLSVTITHTKESHPYNVTATPVDAFLVLEFHKKAHYTAVTEKLNQLNQALLEPITDFNTGIQTITKLCGELLGADCALYNRLDKGLLCSFGQWQTPNGFNPIDKPEGHICYDVIKNAANEVVYIKNLSKTNYFESDPNVRLYGLETYFGHVVRCNNQAVGSLCVVFTENFEASSIDTQIITTLALWLSNYETQEELLQRERKYHELFEFAGGGLILGNKDGVITDVNIKFELITGFKNNELIGRHISALFTKESLVEKPLRFDLLDKGESVTTNRRLQKKDGNIITIEMHSTRNPDGTYLAIFHDVTEKLKQENEHYKTAIQYKALFDFAPLGILLIDKDGLIVDGNKTICDSFKTSKTELIGSNIINYAPQHIKHQVEENINTILNGKDLHHEVQTMSADGTIFYSELFETLIPFPNGEKGILSLSKDITDRKISELALRESEQKFRVLAQASPAAIFIHQDGYFKYVNPATCLLTGFSEAELLDLRFWEIIHPEYRDMVKQRGLSRVAGEDVQRTYEFKIIQRNGNTIWLDFAGAVTTFNGKPAGMGFAYDITSYKLAQESVLKQKTNLQLIIDKLPHTLFIKDKSGKLILVNQAFASLFNSTPNQIMGKHENDFALDTNYLDRYAKEDLEVIEQKKQLTILEEFKSNKGITYFQTTKTPLNLSDADETYVLGLVMDITSLKQTEDQFRKSEITYRGIIDSITEAVYVQDGDGIFLDVNKAVESMYGYEQSYFIGKTPAFLSAPDKNDLKKVGDALSQAFNGIPQQFEFYGIRKNGEVFPKEVSLTSGQYFGQKVVFAVARDITARKQAEEALSERKRILRTILDNVPIGVWMLGADKSLRFVNQAFCKATGISESKFLSARSYTELYDEQTALSCYQSDKITFETGQPTSTLETIRFTDNKRHENQIIKSPVKDESGAILGLIGISIDVTERNALENSVRQQLKFSNALNDIAQIIISTNDAEALLNTASRILGEALDVDRFEIYSVSKLQETVVGLIEWLNPANQSLVETLACFPLAMYKNCIEHMLSTYQPIAHNLENPDPNVLADYQFIINNTEFCHQNVKPAGAFEPFLSEFEKVQSGLWFPFWFKDNGFYLFAINRITRNEGFKNIELDFLESASRQISIALEKLHLIEQKNLADDQLRRLSHAIEQSPACNIITNTEGRIIYVNSKVTELTGYQPEELLGKTTEILGNGTLREELDHQLWQTIRSGKTWKGEFLNKKKDGEIYWAYASISPIYDVKGQIAYYLSVQEDITEDKKNLMDLEDAKEKAEESDRLKTAFLNNISHEIRTPISGVCGFADLLTLTDLNDSERLVYTNSLEASLNRLINTVEDFVDMSMLATKTKQVSKTETDLGALMWELYEKNESECTSKNLSLKLLIPKESNVIIRCDADLLKKSLQHLIGNAIKFTKQGSIEFGYHAKPDELEFCIKDTGIGIDANAMEFIFKPFNQENYATTRGYEGSGLGLSIAKGFIELMGGKIWCKSQKDFGSSFYFSLPNPYLNINRVAKPFPIVSQKAGDTIKILIAEDEPDNFFYLQTVLKIHTYSTVFHATNGEHAIELVHNNPDLFIVLMDLKMPFKDGLEATRLLRDCGYSMPIIAITAHAGSEDNNHALQAGCNDFVTKPINRETLLKTLESNGVLIRR